jgi:hypothetical protein
MSLARFEQAAHAGFGRKSHPARRNMKIIRHLAVSVLAFSAAITLSGCVGATRLPMRTKGPAGESLQSKRLDLSFLDSPGTQRDEVVCRLGSVDTGYSNPRLLWARWSESKWGYWWFIAAQTGGAGDAKRVWHVHNLLVSFDQDGVVREKELVNEDKSMWVELHNRLAETPALDLSEPIQIGVLGPGRLQTISLRKDSIHVDLWKGKVMHFEVSPQAIVRFSHGLLGASTTSPVTCHTLHLAEKTPLGKKIVFCASPAHVATTFQYLQQYGTPQLRWD